MGAMYRLKAYFGMVPAEEMGAYVDDSAADRYADHRRPERTVREYADERWDDRFTYDDEPERADRFDRPERMDRHERPDRTDRTDRYDDDRDRRPPRPMVPERPRAGGGPGPSAVRGALAIDPESVLREPVRPVPSVVPEQRERPVAGAAALARITTLQPRSYREARTIGERYRAGQPVIMNLTELDAAEAKRLVDFAAGLVFALHGGFDKVTNRVFLLTPADVEVSADDARMLAERGILRAD
ncbi:cell division protein SepF [Pseudonocardia aurantiaca]|uniref:Cell division protein SepF n=1 Tax=Pseudonocardia aurantiaca TaxID=75290 RepID=A0ABW4FFF7_9PSEU